MPTTSPSFFNSYEHPRPLHSFPTRRSSDLLIGAPSHAGPVFDGLISSDLFASFGKAIMFPASAVAIIAAQNWFEREDRKSTRLNSSHVESSYAVFCLKKKKRKIDSATTLIH